MEIWRFEKEPPLIIPVILIILCSRNLVSMQCSPCIKSREKRIIPKGGSFQRKYGICLKVWGSSNSYFISKSLNFNWLVNIWYYFLIKILFQKGFEPIVQSQQSISMRRQVKPLIATEWVPVKVKYVMFCHGIKVHFILQPR